MTVKKDKTDESDITNHKLTTSNRTLARLCRPLEKSESVPRDPCALAPQLTHHSENHIILTVNRMTNLAD